MRATIHNYIEAAKRRKQEETGEEGFSLIELIIVVVIIAILAAIAVPIFLNIQQNAKNSAVQGIAGNAAAAVAADLANSTPVTTAGAAPGAAISATIFKAPAGTTVMVMKTGAGSTIGLDNYCVKVTATSGNLLGANAAASGPGANAAGTDCS